MINDSLLPCKRCGRNFTHRLIIYSHLSFNNKTYRLSCINCGYCTKEKNTEEEARKAWDQRDRIKEKINE